MDAVNIVGIEQREGGYHVIVEVGNPNIENEMLTYNVVVDEDYYENLTSKTVDVETLVEETFKFLLEREPKESIMREFDLDKIGTLFPKFEFEIKTRLDS